MDQPLAYFISWTTYGTWLHGDERGWVEGGKPGIQPPDPAREEWARKAMTQEAVTLTVPQRELVRATIERHCEIRGWKLLAVNPRSNHVHVVVAAQRHPDEIMNQFKAWCSRRLSEATGLPKVTGKSGHKKWWTEHGSTKWIWDEEYLHNAIEYVMNRQ